MNVTSLQRKVSLYIEVTQREILESRIKRIETKSELYSYYYVLTFLLVPSTCIQGQWLDSRPWIVLLHLHDHFHNSTLIIANFAWESHGRVQHNLEIWWKKKKLASVLTKPMNIIENYPKFICSSSSSVQLSQTPSSISCTSIQCLLYIFRTQHCPLLRFLLHDRQKGYFFTQSTENMKPCKYS